jgi:hypothetical protein
MERLFANFTHKFVSKTLKQRREELLFEHERALMPATQHLAEQAKKLKDIKIESDKLHTQNGEFGLVWDDIMRRPADTDDEILKRYRDTFPIRRQISENNLTIDFLNYRRNRILNRPTRQDQEVRRFMRCCPATGCKGFLSTGWKCGMCETKVCPRCHEIKGDEDTDHVCQPENIATALLLARDTRSCPKCATQIFKIDGCDQMWCTQCHTTFSWQTGRMATGRTHNPHYYEYLRQRNNGVIPREQGDEPPDAAAHRQEGCAVNGPMPSTLQKICNDYRPADPMIIILMTILRATLHNEYINRHKWQPVAANNEDIRISYMIDDITEEQFKKELQKREKAHNKKREMWDILTMYYTIIKETLNKVVHDQTDLSLINGHIREMTALRDYANLQMGIVSKRYNCVFPHIDEVSWFSVSTKV